MSWPARGTQAFDLAGYTFAVTWDSAAGARAVERLFPSCRIDPALAPPEVYAVTATGAGLQVCRGGHPVAAGDTEAEVAAALDAELANAALEHLVHAVAIHAGAVAREGRALLLPGAGGSGKTTLTAALSLAGLQPLCDDIVLLDPAGGRARALPRNFLIKGASARWVAARLAGAEAYALGGELYSIPREALGQPVDAAAVAWIVFPTFAPGLPARLAPVGPLEAMRRLLPLTCLPHQDLFGVVGMVREARVFELPYRSHEEAVALLLALVRGEPPG